MLARVLNPDCIRIKAKLSDKDSVLREIATMASETLVGRSVSADRILEGLHERETLCSTGFGSGLAIPHCRLAELSEFLMGAMTLETPVEFNSLDGLPVNLVFFLLGPEEGKREHIHLLSQLAHICRRKGTIESFQGKETVEELYDAIVGSASAGEKPTMHRKMDMIHIFVKDDEDLFNEILEVGAAFDSSMITVVDTQDVAKILSHMPLFMGLMGGTRTRFARFLIMAFDHALTNELIRRIEEVTGPLSSQNDVFLTVQPLYFAGGQWRD